MPLSFLKSLRVFIPAALILVYWSLLGKIVGLWKISIPDFSKDYYTSVMIVPAAIYYITPLRKWINAPYHNRVVSNLRVGLVNVAGYSDKPNVYTWKSLRSLFFSLVDGDDSLKIKASLAYLNGLLWTSFANLTAISSAYALVAAILYFLKIEYAAIAFVVFCGIAMVSIVGSIVTTSKQIEIGDEQLEIIQLKYKSEVERRLNTLDS